jgi:hypothetical protein
MLTGTRSFVRTNYGDTDSWPVNMGIIQGSVLSAILFIIFISPMSTDLAHLSLVINQTPIPPQLFADDGTGLAEGETACRALVVGILAWGAKWKMILNMIKSKVMALNDDATPIFANKKIFELVANTIALGVGIDSKGVYSTAFLSSLLSRLVTKVRSLMQVGVRLGALRPDMGLHLYASLALSLVKYALPLAASATTQLRSLEAQQERFAIDYLGLPPSTPPHAAKAELGLIDYDLMAKTGQLLLHHRIHNNREDKFTRALTTWNMGGGRGSKVDECTQTLRTISPSSTWGHFTNLPYAVAKSQLKESTLRLQHARWSELEVALGHQTAYAILSKPHWGMEKSLQTILPTAVTVYIRVRNGAGLQAHHSDSGMCALCHRHPQSEAHLLWACAHTRQPRLQFLDEAKTQSPRALALLLPLHPETAFHYLMGAGASTNPENEWLLFQRAAVNFVVQVFGERHNQH